MSASAAVARGREARIRLGLFPSTATVRREGAATVQDEDTGLMGSAWTDVYDGPFRYVGGSTRRIEVAGVEFQEATGRADFPADTTDLADGDVIEITAGEWTGTFLRIVEATKGDQRTARRVPVVEVPRPEEWV